MKRTVKLLHQQAAIGGVHETAIGDPALLVFALARAVVANAHVSADDFAVFRDADAFSDRFLHIF